MKKQKYSCYLRPDQAQFLRNLPNASSFVREALDRFIAESDRGKTEKTICLYEGAKELEGKIASQALILEGARKEAQKIEEEIKESQYILGVAQKIMRGDFTIREIHGKFRVVAEREEGKWFTVSAKDLDTEEEARKHGVERGKIAVENHEKILKKLKEKKQQHERYLEAQKAKLKDMKKNLEALKARMSGT